MNALKLAFRSILHFRMYSLANIIGLALSLACVITIFRYVYGEFTVDRFNKKIDRIFMVTQETDNEPGKLRLRSFFTGRRDFIDWNKNPGVEKYSDIVSSKNDEIVVNERTFNATVLAADSNFFKIIDYPVISGKDNLSDRRSALISESFARKIFGKENPVGQTFLHSSGQMLTITGVTGQPSTKSTQSFDIIVSLYLSRQWMRTSQTYVLLYPDVDYRTINKQYETFAETGSPWKERFQLFPLSKVYFDRDVLSLGLVEQGNRNYVNILIAVGALILLTGIFNNINVYIVIVLRRGRELGIKKVFGAGGHNIFIQLLFENILTAGLSLFFAMNIANIASPFISNVLQLDQIPNIRFDLLLSFFLILLFPLTTTLYPFLRFYYSTPVNSMRNFDKIKDTGSLRRVFLSFQYIITFIMIIVSLFFVKQFHFMMNTDPGFRSNDIIKVQFEKYNPVEKGRTVTVTKVNADGSVMISDADVAAIAAEEAEKKRREDEKVQKINACPLLTYWTYGQSPMGEFKSEKLFKIREGGYKEINQLGADEGWLKLFDIKLKEGRLFDDKIDNYKNNDAIIVTESFLKEFGISDFNNIELQTKSRYSEKETSVRIVGVVKDFNYLHLSQKSTPIAIGYQKKWNFEPVIAAIVPGRTEEAIEFLRKLHEETVGGEFTYSFVEDEIREMYKEDKKIATIYSVFTFIAIFISALGLFSMSLFDIQRRRKEIAIRKINGATFQDIIRMLLKKYFLTLSVSFVIAVPIALLAISRYLEDFANKAPVSWWLFAVALAITAGISLLTLVWQTGKAAGENPAEVVKKE